MVGGSRFERDANEAEPNWTSVKVRCLRPKATERSVISVRILGSVLLVGPCRQETVHDSSVHANCSKRGGVRLLRPPESTTRPPPILSLLLDAVPLSYKSTSQQESSVFISTNLSS